jgi:RNA polymerase primary sigma factor
MASETKVTLQNELVRQEEDHAPLHDRPLLDSSDTAIKKLIQTVKKRGYVTQDQISSVLSPEEVNSEQIEDVLAMFSEMGINVVETEEASEDEEHREEPDEEAETESSDLVEVRRAVPAKSEAKEPVKRTDDPVRMYLREMGSVELLSRQGEIAIAKRIEAGREAMIAGLCESPLTFQAIVIWRDELNEGKVFLRDIIDLEATYAGPDAKAMPVPVIGPEGQPIPPLPIADAPPLAQTLAPPAVPAGATAFKAAPMPAEGEEAEVGESAHGEGEFDDYGKLALACCHRGRAQAQGAGNLRQYRRRLQAAAPPPGSGHRIQAQEHHPLAGAGASLQEARARYHLRGEVAPIETDAHRFASRAALRHQ